MADQLITFHIYLTDQELCREMQAQFPSGWIHGPEPAASELGIAYQAPDAPFVAPCVRTPYNPTGSSGKFFTDRAVFTINNGGFFGFFGASTRFIWVGFFEYSPPPTPPDPPGAPTPPPQVAMAQRYNISGFELPADGGSLNGEGGTGALTQWISRDASRTLEGYGVAYRGLTSSTLVKTPSDHVSPAPTPNAVWQRMYIRLRALPNAPQGFWRCNGSPSGNSGALMQITPSGTIQVSNMQAGGTIAQMGQSSPLELDRWYKLDLLVFYNPLAPTFDPISPFARVPTFGTFYLFIDGMQDVFYKADDIAQGGLGDNTSRIQSSTLGPYSGVTLAGLEMDIDDWVISDFPLLDANGNRTGLDWLNGSHCQHVVPSAFGAGHSVNWTGNFRNLLLRPVYGSSTLARLASSTSGAILSALTDAKFAAESKATVLGAASMVVGLYSSRASVDGTLGWSIDGGAFDLATIVQSTSIQWNSRLYRPSGQVLPIAALDPLELRHVKGASAGASSVGGLQAVIELIGTFGPEDVNPGERYPIYSEWTATWGGVGLGYSIGSKVRHNNQNYTAIATASSIHEPGVATTIWAADPLTAYQVGDRVYHGRNIDTNSGANVRYRCIQAHGTVHIPGESGSDAYWEIEQPVAALPATGPHNAPYPSSPWAAAAAPPISPVVIVGGTYVGNGVGQDLTFRIPVHFLWVRPLTGDTGGTHWWTTMIGAHRNYQYGIEAENMVQALMDASYVSPGGSTDPETRALVRVTGANTQSNANGVTYQYIAFCDPGARFLLNGSFAHGSSPQVALAVNALVDAGFTPQAAFFIIEQIGVTTTNSMYYKGSGYAADEGQEVVSTAVNTSLATFGAGVIKSRTPLHVGGTQQTAYAAWRKDDGSGDVGVPSVLKIGSYVGNGVASRSIGLSPTSGKRPLWAFIIAHGSGSSGSIYRDPSHTGTTSTNVGNGSSNASTGITGGDIDSFTVGSNFNSNGVIYDYIVLMGSATAGNGGWSPNGEFIPVVPAPAPGGPWPPNPPYDPDDPEQPLVPPADPEPAPGDIGENPDFDNGDNPLPGTDLFCLTFTQQAVNLALARLGVSIVIDNIATETTQAATIARLHVKTDVEFVLSAFPWEFARKYATLALIDGSASDPVNSDWTFSYRRPTDCIFERRIARSRGAAVNPTSPPFSIGSDSGGALIFSNEENAKLEYTARGLCPAYQGDSLFKEALIWKIAASLSPALTRIAGKTADCLAEMEKVIARAYDVQRPGNPGPVGEPDADAFDQTAAATAANVATVNRALIRIGARTIASLALSDQSREAIAARLIFEDELKATLRDFAWQFATRYAELALVAGAATWDDALIQTWDIARTYEENDAVSVAGVAYYALRQTLGDAPTTSPNDWTTTEPEEANGDWLRAYRVPTNSVRARRLVKQTARRVYDLDPTPFKLGTDEGGEILFTDAEQAVLEFTERIDNLLARADALFRDAFAWRLSASLAPSLAQIDPEELEQAGRGTDATANEHKRPTVKANKAAQRQAVARFALARYYDVLEQAKAGDANEGQPEPAGDASWIQGR